MKMVKLLLSVVILLYLRLRLLKSFLNIMNNGMRRLTTSPAPPLSPHPLHPPPPRHPFRPTLHFSFIAFIPLSYHSSAPTFTPSPFTPPPPRSILSIPKKQSIQLIHLPNAARPHLPRQGFPDTPQKNLSQFISPTSAPRVLAPAQSRAFPNHNSPFLRTHFYQPPFQTTHPPNMANAIFAPAKAGLSPLSALRPLPNCRPPQTPAFYPTVAALAPHLDKISHKFIHQAPPALAPQGINYQTPHFYTDFHLLHSLQNKLSSPTI